VVPHDGEDRDRPEPVERAERLRREEAEICH
jgi:hypothetical protein